MPGGMRRFGKFAAAAVMLALALDLAQPASAAEKPMSTDAYATKFFLDTPPSAADLARLPADARDVIVAKVRINFIAWNGIRDQSGLGPARQPKFEFGGEFVAIDVLSGKADVGQRYNVLFAVRGRGKKYVTPITPPHTSSGDYFVVCYLDSDETRTLLGFPVGQEEYERWDREFWEHELKRNRPGAQDP